MLTFIFSAVKVGHYFAGGGIVVDSDPESELAETRWKGAQIERLVAASLNGAALAPSPERRR